MVSVNSINFVVRIFKVSLLGFTVLLVSCNSDVAPHHNENLSAINQHLVAASRTNKRIENTEKPYVPSVVAKSLLPSTTHLKSASGSGSMDVVVSDIEIKPFLLHLVKGTPYSVTVASDVSGKVSLQMPNTTIEKVLLSLRNNYGFEFSIDGDSIEVFMPKLETKVFMVNHIDIEREGSSSLNIKSSDYGISSTGDTGSSSDVSDISVSTTSSDTFWAGIEKTIEMLIGGTSKAEGTPSFTINKKTGLVVVRADQKSLRNIEHFLAVTQSVESRQVLLEATILEVQLSKEFDTGIDWEAAGFTSESSSDDSTTINSPLISTGYSNIFKMNESSGKFSIAIDMLSKEGKVSVLSNPRVSTMNNQKAMIKIGDDAYYVTSLSSTDLIDDSTAVQSNIGLHPFFSGLALDILPQIDKDNNVVLHIHPSISLTSTKETTVTVAGDDTVIPTAETSVRESDSIVRAKNGQVVIIGGLMETMTDVRRSGVPPLNDKPVLKHVNDTLTSKTDGVVKTELVMLLKPVVVDNKTWTQEVQHLADDSFNEKTFANVTN